MMSAYFSILTRRVSISLYQRARYSSIVQGTLPASQLPTESLSNGRHLTRAAARKQVPKKKGEKKPKRNSSPQDKSLAELGIKIIRPARTFTVQGITFGEKPLFMLDKKIRQEAAAASEKYAEELVRKRKERLSFTQKNIDDVESGKKKGSYWQQLMKYLF